MTHQQTPTLTVICPLAYERNALVRIGCGRHPIVECCGPGADQVTRWVENARASIGAVVLAGLAGGLNPALPAGEANWCSSVLDHDGACITPSYQSGALRMMAHDVHQRHGWTVTSAAQTVCTVAAKASLHRNAGADIVDLESAAFARAASARGWSWGIVRAVSDDAFTSLPEAIAQWTRPDGRTHLLRIVRDIARQPRLVPPAFQLQRSGNRGLRAIASLLRSEAIAMSRDGGTGDRTN